MKRLQELKLKINSLKGHAHGKIGEVLVAIDQQLSEVQSILGIKDTDLKLSESTIHKVVEAAPIGSFDYIREKIVNAINDMPVFDPDGDGDNDKYNTYIVSLFPDRVIVASEDAYYEMTYTIGADGVVTLGDPMQVEQYFTATESNVPSFRLKTARPSPMARELKESGIVITKEAADIDFSGDVGTITARIKEGSFNPDTGEVDIVIVEAGTNPLKRRHYPISTVREAAGIFAGMKMYINHQTEREERERPERDLRDWVSTIQESNFDGKSAAIGRVYIHDSWLRENMKDPVFAKNVGLSINTGGKISYGKINGEEMQIVEKINPSRSNGSGSVDWVTEAGARGRVLQPIKESASNQETQIEETAMTLKEVKLAQLEAENPELVKQIRESAGGGDATKLAEANRVIEEFKRKEKLRDQKDVLKKMLKESKLPEAAKDRIVDDLSGSVFETEDKLKEALTGKIKTELEYINSISGKGKIKIGSPDAAIKEGTGSDLLKESQASLESRFGIKDKKEEE